MSHNQPLIRAFDELPDPRQTAKCTHLLGDLLVIAACTLLSGGSGFNDMELFARTRLDWLRTFLKLPGGAPRHDTFNRLFAALDPEAFLDAFIRWVQSVRLQVDDEVVALDGKALRRAAATGEPIPYLISVWATTTGLALGQRKVADKSNEITAVPDLLRVLDLAGCVVTADALLCQKRVAQEIIEADAQYVLALKGNHGTAYQEMKSYLDAAIEEGEPGLSLHEEVDKDHGRLEIRRCWQSRELDWFADRDQWEGLRTVAVVESVRQVGQQEATTERRYYLSSLPLDAAAIQRAVRAHWGIENQLHWSLDVTFGEDQSRARSGHAAQNLALVRKWSLNRLREDRANRTSLRGKRLQAAWDGDYLKRLLTS